MTGIDYSGLTTALTDLLEYTLVSASSATPSSDSNFNAILPSIINDAEQRIYREIDFLFTREQAATLPVTISSRSFTIPSEIVVVESIALIVPSTDTPAQGTRVYPLRVSLDTFNLAWPQESYTSPPVQNACYYTMLNNATALIAPTPDAAYPAEVTGIFVPTPMSSTNTTTILGTYYPDLFLAACCVFAFGGFQRDFAGGADQQTPQSQTAANWESHYVSLRQSVVDRQRRARGLQPEEGSAQVSQPTGQ